MKRHFHDWDGEHTLVRYDGESGAWIFIAVHSTRLGRAVGGTRMRRYPEVEEGLRDAHRLSRAMTYKWAAVDFPLGGGKGVLAVEREMVGAEREALLERYGRMVESLGGGFGTGVDLGTAPSDLDVIGRETDHVFGRSEAHGGSGDPGPWTALGVAVGIEAAAEVAWSDPDLDGRTVLVQGVGGVGAPLARRLAREGARLKLSDVDRDRAERLAAEVEGEVVDPEEVYAEPCDVFAPCAVGGVLNRRTADLLQCEVVAGSANNQLDERTDAGRLHERGILYAPDFVINAGGAIAHAGLEALEMAEEEVRRRIAGIGDSLRDIFREASRRGESPLSEAERRAERVLERGPRDP